MVEEIGGGVGTIPRYEINQAAHAEASRLYLEQENLLRPPFEPVQSLAYIVADKIESLGKGSGLNDKSAQDIVNTVFNAIDKDELITALDQKLGSRKQTSPDDLKPHFMAEAATGAILQVMRKQDIESISKETLQNIMAVTRIFFNSGELSERINGAQDEVDAGQNIEKTKEQLSQELFCNAKEGPTADFASDKCKWGWDALTDKIKDIVIEDRDLHHGVDNNLAACHEKPENIVTSCAPQKQSELAVGRGA